MSATGAMRTPCDPLPRRRVLFVDDEPHILEGLRDSLHSQRRQWKMAFALGADRALEMLGGERFDVVVSDMRMPGMDGATLLAHVRDRDPSAVRIVLSGYAEEKSAVRAAGVAHHFLPKPCTREDLHSVIERACSLRSMIDADSLRRTAAGIDALPSAPSLFVSLERVTAETESTPSDVAAVIEQDVAMSAKVLQLVNSSFFGVRRRLASVTEAVQYIGVGPIRALALSEGTFRSFEPKSRIEGFDIEGLQRHSQRAAHIARGLLAHDKAASDIAFTATMLHDVGKLVLAAHWPDDLSTALAAARAEERPLDAIEYQRHGSSHAELGAYVLGLWGLPHAVVEAVAFHHAPARAVIGALDPVLAVHVADHLAHVVSAERAVQPPPLLDGELLERLDLAKSLPAWLEMAAGLEDAR